MVLEPGMLVRCIRSVRGVNVGKTFWVLEVYPGGVCELEHGPCSAVVVHGMKSTHWTGGWAGCCFAPLGGDREVEAEKMVELGTPRVLETT